MSEEKNSTEMFAAGRSNTAEDTEEKLGADAGGLGPMHAGSIVIGLVEEIVGEGGVEVPGCKVTKYELIQIVKHWAAEIVDSDFSYFLYGCTGSSEWRTREYANRRLNTIAKSIGEEEVKKAFKQTEEAYGKDVDQRAWKIFMEGTKEEQEAFQAEIEREMKGTEDPEAIAKITAFMQSLGLDSLVNERKAVRFAILASTAAAVADPPCILVPVLEYLNADENDGRYTKNPDGFVPPIEWELRHVALSPIELKRIQRLPDPGQAVDNIDLVMLRPDPAAGREFGCASNSARWKKNPELVAEVEKAAVVESSALAAKIAGKVGIGMFDDFRTAFTALVGE
jgi:hypothetical protein